MATATSMPSSPMMVAKPTRYGSYVACIRGHDQGFQDGLVACSKAMGGIVEPADLAELGRTDNQLSGDNNNHALLALWAVLAFVLALGGGFFVLRRRRAH